MIDLRAKRGKKGRQNLLFRRRESKNGLSKKSKKVVTFYEAYWGASKKVELLAPQYGNPALLILTLVL